MMPAPTDTMAYIAVLPCGCVVEAIVDNPQYTRDIARAVKKASLDGCSIERMTVEEARGRWTGRNCPKCKEAADASAE